MLKLCIFGDIHYIDKKPNWSVNRKLVEYAEKLTIKLVDKINNNIKPDIVINLGDIIQASGNLEEDKKIILFSHFGIAEDINIKENFWCYSEDGENLMLRNRRKLKELIKDKNIIAVFCGHQHWTKKIEESGINYYMLGSLTENINNDGIPDGVYFEVEILKDNVVVNEKHLKIDIK